MSHKESLTEIMDRNKRILLAEYQKGFLAGFKDAEQKLIEEILPHFEWALKELYSTHYNNVKYQIHNNYYIKLKERSK